MKIILIVLLGSSFITINARVIEKITDRILTTETKTTGSPPVRLRRDVYGEDSVTGFSKKDNVQSYELMRTYNRKARHFFRSKPRTDALSSLIRLPRESHRNVEKSTKKTTASASVPTKQKNTLVKKPIPKFNGMDYEDDFQMKVSQSPVTAVDPGENEDEDFNLSDYDFDVNHDEFIGRGKPLEPRTKQKMTHERLNQQSTNRNTKSAVHPEMKMKNKMVAPATLGPVSNKKERAIESSLRKGEKDEYYDDATTTKAPEKETSGEMDDELNDKSEESKELEGKILSARTIRSPWKIHSYMDKLGEKSSSVMAKVLSILPLFPQVPNKNIGEENIKGPAMEPWLARS